MLIVGLTGSIGMGKSTAAARFRERGFAVFDADAEVHRLYDGPIASEIGQAFPGTVVAGKIDRARLAERLIAEPQRFAELEAIVHPKVRDGERRFLRAEHARGAEIVVLEIPLLLETGGDARVDNTIVVSAAPEIQRRRAMERHDMTEAKFESIIARQLSEADKRWRADFIVDTSGSVENCHSQIDAIIAKLRGLRGEAYARFWRD
jgi:dephospho-CoA kinase